MFTRGLEMLVVYFVFHLVLHVGGNPVGKDLQKVFDEIEGHKDTANEIIEYLTTGEGKHKAYNRLAEFVDKFGPRFDGSEALERSIDHLLKELKEEGFENVHGEEVKIPHWVRGEESAELVKPRHHVISILGLGGSVGTQPEGIEAEVIVVKTFKELEERAEEVKDKIVVFNQEWVTYSKSVEYRFEAASAVAKLGGVAALVRSVTSLSIYSPHTGMMTYDDKYKRIPTASITVEDAEMLERMADRGEEIIIKMKMGAKMLPWSKSRNIVADIKGSEKPEEVVVISAHLDSWDVGQGAMDDGGGVFITLQALTTLRELKLRPKRTLRLVLFVSEEMWYKGAEGYYNAHKNESDTFSIIMETDEGTYKPDGLNFEGSPKAVKIMEKTLSLLQPINATILRESEIYGDIEFWVDKQVPTAHLRNSDKRYMLFHHTDGDTMTALDAGEMDLCAALWTVSAYVLADLEEKLPR